LHVYLLQFGAVGYHLYVLYYASKSHNASRRHITAHVTRRTNQLAARGCSVTFGVKNVRDIAERSRDAYDVNLAMMDAYLDDGVDFFLLLFPHVPAATSDPGDRRLLTSRSLSCLISLWPPYGIWQAIIFLPCGFYLLLLSFYLFSSSNLSGRRLDVYHTSTMVWP